MARLRVIGLVAALALAFGAGYGVRAWTPEPPAPATEAERHYADFEVFWQAWDLAQANFVQPDKIDPKQMTYGAIQGMLGSLGDEGHTRFLSPDEREQWQASLSGSFVGIGIEIALREGQPVILAVYPGTPAEAAGLRAADVILQIDGKETAGLDLEELSHLMRGEEGTSVTLTLRHESQDTPETVTATRQKIDLPTVAWTLIPGQPGIAHLRISQFSDGTRDETVAAVKAAKAAGARAIILDLRNDPGGLLDEAINTASEFLSGGVVMQVQSRDGARKEERDRNGAAGVDIDLPLVTLVNEGTASSAEILAGALKQNDRARVIGQTTAGTGTVLSTYELNDGSAILLGTLLWLTPHGDLIKGKGITPDIPVALPAGATPLRPSEAHSLTPEALRNSQDRQLLRAIEELSKQMT